MYKKLINSIVFILVLLLAICIWLRTSQRKSPTPENIYEMWAEFHDSILDNQIGYFRLINTEVYPEPGLGYKTSYSNQKADGPIVNIFIYDLNMKGIPEGTEANLANGKRRLRIVSPKDSLLKSHILLEQMDKAVSDITQSKDYRKVHILSRGQTKLPGKYNFLWHRFELQGIDNNKPLISELFLTGFKGKFVKVRVSVDKDKFEDNKKDLAEFLMALSNLLEKRE